MLLFFWRNPEFIRHRRAELRRSRALTVLVIVAIVCLLIGLACWTQVQHDLEISRRGNADFGRPSLTELQRLEQRAPTDFWQLFYHVLTYGQVLVLTFWTLFSCAQGISGERERKTWDFQRTTRLRPSELLIGKLLGGPILAYFIVICSLPITLLAGLCGEVDLLAIAYAVTLIFASALFVGVVGLWISNLFESQSRGLGVLGALGLIAVMTTSSSLQRSNFPGFAALNPITGLIPWAEGTETMYGIGSAALFGRPVPWVFASLFLYVTFGAWFALMLLRNLKKDHEELHLLSRWQVVGCAGFLNFVFYALFSQKPWVELKAADFANMMVFLNALILLATGMATLTPHERLKVWWRQWHGKPAGWFAEDGLMWPWLVISAAVAYGLMVWGLFAWRHTLGYDKTVFQSAVVQLFAVLVFVIRDVLFVQWCKLTRMRAPLVKGVLFVGLYYGAAATLALMFTLRSEGAMHRFVNLATPVGVFDDNLSGFRFPATVFLGVAFQLVVIIYELVAINRQLARPAVISTNLAG